MANLSGPPVTRATFLAAAAGWLLAACSNGDDTRAGTDTSDDNDTRRGPAAAAALTGATTINGEPFDAALLAGRPTVAWFWAPWCVVCRGEAPDVAEVAARYADLVNIVGVAGRGRTSEMLEFVADVGVDRITHLDDSTGAIWASYEIYAQPAFAFITVDGVLETFVGSLGGAGLADRIDKLIAT